MHDKETSFDEKKQLKEQEPLGKELFIARLISPHHLHHQVAEIVGIPFAREQLESISIVSQGKSKSLLQLMNELDLIGKTDGIPHLSVGGGISRGDQAHRLEKSSQLLIPEQTSRSYLVGDLSIQGSGLVHYQEKHNVGFGLDLPIQRSTGEDIGGGVTKAKAESNLHKSELIRLLAQLYFSDGSHFARVLATFDYHSWLAKSVNRTTSINTGIAIREDGPRSVPKEKLLTAIYEVLPFLTDYCISPADFFAIDGRNAFIKEGGVVFTDYEAIRIEHWHGHDNFIELSNQWYYEMFRSRFRLFCHSYGFKPLGDQTHYNNATFLEGISAFIRNNSEYSSSFFNASDSHPSVSPKEFEKRTIKRAMAGTAGSRSLAKRIGRNLVREVLEKQLPVIETNPQRPEDLYNQLIEQSSQFVGITKKSGLESCTLRLNSQNELEFHLQICTFGLPIESAIVLPFTLADLYESWPLTIDTASVIHKKGLVFPTDDNEFANLPKDLFSSTFYSIIASMLHDMQGFDRYGESPQFEEQYIEKNRYGLKVMRGVLPITLPMGESIHIYSDLGLSLTLYFDGRCSLISSNNLADYTVSQINKVTYAMHACLLKIQSDPKAATHIRIELNARL